MGMLAHPPHRPGAATGTPRAPRAWPRPWVPPQPARERLSPKPSPRPRDAAALAGRGARGGGAGWFGSSPEPRGSRARGFPAASDRPALREASEPALEEAAPAPPGSARCPAGHGGARPPGSQGRSHTERAPGSRLLRQRPSERRLSAGSGHGSPAPPRPSLPLLSRCCQKNSLGRGRGGVGTGMLERPRARDGWGAWFRQWSRFLGIPRAGRLGPRASSSRAPSGPCRGRRRSPWCRQGGEAPGCRRDRPREQRRVSPRLCRLLGGVGGLQPSQGAGPSAGWGGAGDGGDTGHQGGILGTKG